MAGPACLPMKLTPMRFSITCVCLLSAGLSSCFGYRYKDIKDEAWVPVYSTENIHAVTSLPVRPTTDAGKIYVQGNLLFQVENLAGVHIIDYSDKAHPVKLAFVKCRGCSEVAYKNSYLVINNMRDLVFVDVHDPLHAREASRVPDAFPVYYPPHFTNDRPPQTGKYYVCPDYTKGDVVDWKLEKKVQAAWCY